MSGDAAVSARSPTTGAQQAMRPESNASSDTLIDAHHVGRSFTGPNDRSSAQVLSDVSLSVRRGEFVGLIGPSGCGKTTLLHILGGLLEPSAGTVTVAGVGAAQATKGGDVGLVFQEPALLPWLDVTGNIAFLRSLRRRSRKHLGSSAGDRMAELLELAGLTNHQGKKPHELSGGMQQRVAIARALFLEPSVLVMDEPFGALDEITREHMNLSLLNIWTARPFTCVFVTHSINEAVLLSDTVYVLGGNPATVQERIDVTVERPRSQDSYESSEFRSCVDRLRSWLFTYA